MKESGPRGCSEQVCCSEQTLRCGPALSTCSFRAGPKAVDAPGPLQLGSGGASGWQGTRVSRGLAPLLIRKKRGSSSPPCAEQAQDP